MHFGTINAYAFINAMGKGYETSGDTTTLPVNDAGEVDGDCPHAQVSVTRSVRGKGVMLHDEGGRLYLDECATVHEHLTAPARLENGEVAERRWCRFYLDRLAEDFRGQRGEFEITIKLTTVDGK